MANQLGSFDRDYLATRDIEIEIHNLSQLPARIAIDFYFVGRPQRLPTPDKLFSKHSFIVNVAASDQEQLSLRSDVLRSREVYYAALGEIYFSGYEIEGWILFVRLPGQPQPFDKVSSNKAMLEHLDWFPNALQQFENAPHRHPNYASEIEPEPAPVPEAEPNEMEPSTPLIVVQPTPEPIETSVRVNIPAVPAPTQASPPPAIFITVTKPYKDHDWTEGRDNSAWNKGSANGASGRYGAGAIQGRIDICKNILDGFEVTPVNVVI